MIVMSEYSELRKSWAHALSRSSAGVGRGWKATGVACRGGGESGGGSSSESHSVDIVNRVLRETIVAIGG